MTPSILARTAILAVLLHVSLANFDLPSPWVWSCSPISRLQGKEPVCVKHRRMASSESSNNAQFTSLATCQLTCGSHGTLWPKPTRIQLGESIVRFRPQRIAKKFITLCNERPTLEKGFQVFMDNIDRYHPNYYASKKSGEKLWYSQFSAVKLMNVILSIRIVECSDIRVMMNTSEQYQMSVNVKENIIHVNITSRSYFGARHGLETLSQIIDYEEETDSLQIVSSAFIEDVPAYPYRGILLDTSRNFISVESIERTLDAMAANKLNTFHWHITDTQSFPMVLNSLPKMAYYGAYSPDKLYKPDDIRHIVEYGRIRGVRVLPEFDAPAHVGYGWQWGPEEQLGNLVVCVDREPWQEYCVQPTCGQLNIANPNIYPVLRKVYQEMIELFGPVDLFHYGGDEVNLNCWNTTEEIVSWMRSMRRNLSADSYYEQWSHFQDRAYQVFTLANKNVEVPGIIWTSHLTEKGRVDRFLDHRKYIIQIWSSGTDPLITELLEKKFRVIFSNYDAWYLDCGFGAWVGDGNNWCSPYKGWQKVYDNNPRKIALNMTQGTADLRLVLGGEVALWSEQVDDNTVDSKIWPRAAALAERLWSDPDHGWQEAEYRMIHHRQRLTKRGIMAERLQPEWCHQNEGYCYINKDSP